MAVPQQFALRVGKDAAISAAIALLVHYFDLAPASARLLVKKWLVDYPAVWVRSAVTEALYQGRYKPISVDQILAFWQRRGRVISHFNYEFEMLIAVPLRGDAASRQIEEELVQAPPHRNALVHRSDAMSGDSPASSNPPATVPAIAKNLQSSPDSTVPPRPRLMLPGEATMNALDEREELDITAIGRQTLSSASSSRTSNTGFEAVLQPRPNYQVSQGPDPAILAAAKGQQSQTDPIGPFTPADDPSGFSSRLKAVIEQAISQAQVTQVETEPGSGSIDLSTAITDGIAQDPVLGALTPPNQSLTSPPSDSLTTQESPDPHNNPPSPQETTSASPMTTGDRAPSTVSSTAPFKDAPLQSPSSKPVISQQAPLAAQPVTPIPDIAQVSALLTSLRQSPPNLNAVQEEVEFESPLQSKEQSSDGE